MSVRSEVQELGLEVWEAGMELAEGIGKQRPGLQEQRKAGSVGCANMTLRSDSCLESIQNVDIATVVHMMMEVQIFVMRPFQEEMMSDAVDIDTGIVAVDSTVVIVHGSAKHRQGEATTEFLEALGNLLHSPALEAPIESSLYRSFAVAGRVQDWWLQSAIVAERLAE